MKLILAALLVIIGVSLAEHSNAAVKLNCGAINDRGEFGENEHLLLKERVATIQCGTRSGDNYNVTIDGVGLGLRGASLEALTIICPTVRKSALGVDSFVNKNGVEKKGTKVFYGLKASAGIILGVDGAAFANAKGGICVLAGVQLGSFGLGVSAPKVTIQKEE